MLQKDYDKKRLELLKSIKQLAREICTQNTVARIKKSRIKKNKPGSKEKMTDEQALYLRKESLTRSVSSLCKELNIARNTADNCIKGITYKHLDHICKPQF